MELIQQHFPFVENKVGRDKLYNFILVFHLHVEYKLLLGNACILHHNYRMKWLY